MLIKRNQLTNNGTSMMDFWKK